MRRAALVEPGLCAHKTAWTSAAILCYPPPQQSRVASNVTNAASAGTTRPSAGAIGASVRAIATHVPAAVLSNEDLARQFPDWPAEKILEKTGIRERRIAAADETAADLAYEAAVKLFATGAIDPGAVDFLILCTQAPDYILPTSACILQARLGLRRNIGAFDMNLGCSGFVYGLAVAASLIGSGAASNVLLLTADTYSRYINIRDKSVRTLFGDGAAAALVTRDGSGTIGPFIFGTDGSGASDLIVPAGGFRTPRTAQTGVEQESGGNVRSAEQLFMNGPNVMAFALREVPRTYRELLQATATTDGDVDYLVLHQGNKFMLDALQKKLGLSDPKVPRCYEDFGNTVSSTIPFVLADLEKKGKLTPGTRVFTIGFGVGLSWAGAQIVYQ